MHLGSPAPARSSAHLGLVALILDRLKLGSPLPLQSFVQVGLAVLLVGLSRTDPVSSLSVAESATPGPVVFARSFSRTGLVLLVPDPLRLGPPLPSHSTAHLGSPAFLYGLACSGSVSLLPVVACAHSGPLLLLHSIGCPGSSILALAFGHLGFSLFLQSSSRMGPAVLAFGMTDVGVSPLLLDFVQSGSALFARSLTCPELIPSVPDLLCLDLAPSLRTFGHPDSLALVPGSSCLGFVFLLSVAASTTLGSFLSLRSIAWLGASALVPRYARTDSVPPLRSHGRSGATLPVCGVTCFDSSAFVPDSVHPGSSPLMRSSARSGLVVFALDSLHSGLLLSPRSHVGSELTAPALGLTCLDSVSSPSATATTLLEPSAPAHSFACSGLSPPVLGFSHLGFFVPLRSMGRLGALASAIGLSRMGLVSLLLVVDTVTIEPPSFTQSFARLGFASLATDHTQSGFPSALRAPSRPDLAASVLDSLHLGFSASSQSALRCDPTASVLGVSCLGFISPLPAIDGVRPDLPSLSRSVGRTEVAVFVLAFSHVGLVPTPRSFGCLELAASVSGLLRMGPTLLASDNVMLGISPSPRSSSQPGSAPSVLKFAHAGPAAFSQSFTCVGFAFLVSGITRLDLSVLVSESVHLDPVLSPRSCS